MNVRFIDTSIFVNILDIPNMNDKRSQVIEEFQAVIKDKSQVLILPLATIIETGNHIAHISNGEIRRQKAKRMAAFLENTASGKAPWKYYGKELETDDLLWLAYVSIGHTILIHSKSVSYKPENDFWAVP